ncbi:MAG: hypothetical protein GY835_14665 [bacterium]|nr:hypothetical protein [bacterium]
MNEQHPDGIRPVFTALLILILGLVLSPQFAAAEWREGDYRIMSLSELLPHLGATASSDLPVDTPVLLARGTVPDDIVAIQGGLVRSGLALKPTARGREVVRPAVDEAARAAARLLAVTPLLVNTRAEGVIATGGAVLYGQIVEPPYLVENDGEEVLVNGVLVFPSPGVPVAVPAADAESIREFELVKTARMSYRRDLESLGGEEARSRFRETVLTLTHFVEAEWRSENSLHVLLANGQRKSIIMSNVGREPEEPTSAQLNGYGAMMARNLREMLRLDMTIVAGATYLICEDNASGAHMRDRLREVLDSVEPEALILARLQARLGNRAAAADLYYSHRGGR